MFRVRTKWGKKRRKKVVLPKVETSNDSVHLSGPFSNQQIGKIFEGRRFDAVSFRDCKLIDRAAALQVCKATQIRSIEIWSRITRPALNVLVEIPGLNSAYVIEFAGSGRLRNFRKATELEEFRSSHALESADILHVADLPNLHTLVAQGAQFGVKATAKLASLTTLKVVDFEGVSFTDEMAKALSQSKVITDVLLPATQLSLAGLKSISEMTQLRYLDIWANGFKANDLDLLAGHSGLEVIELGGMGSNPAQQLKACDLIPRLDRLPALKTVYFENVVCTDEEFEYLRGRYEFRLLSDG
jgi:hypothetical protein